MEMPNQLRDAWRLAPYQLGGHGNRTVRVLKDALEGLDGEQGSDMYGKGELIEGFQRKMADYLGKEEAVFFPSGTMAQQIVLRIWCDRAGLKKVAYHPLCHLEIHEEDGLKQLHHIEPVYLADESRVIELEDVLGLEEDIACILLELPQREIGGQLPSYETLVAISAYCREHGIKLHLDGARLFEVTPYYERSAAEICGLFDSVYISFYKGIGGIAGAILAGEQDMVQEAKVWKRRHGGDLISLYPYIVSADHYFDLRIGRMEQYYAEARELAGLFNECHGSITTRPQVPVSNMFHVHCGLPKERLEPLLVELARETGIGVTGNLKAVSEEACSFEISIGEQYGRIPKDTLQESFRLLGSRI
jgi:threonine aldolase